MKTVRLLAAGAAVAWSAAAAGIAGGDARRGEELFISEQCVHCHSVKGRGGSTAPDLARRVDRDFTPSLMASLMWNHAPDMWAGMKKQGIVKATLSTDAAADLFAYFVSARYFEKPGDAGRGKEVFTARHCAGCHGIDSSKAGGAPPVAKWESLADPVILTQQMWNHGPRMREEFAKKKLAWAPLTAQELTDMLVYLKNLPENRGVPQKFEFASSEEGAGLFQSKGCAGCHSGSSALENKLRNQTITEIAVDMWNHQPRMKNPPPTLSPDEMRQILSYVWARQYFRGQGNAERGKRVFAEKSCAGCHGGAAGGAPSLKKGADGYSDISIVSALWEHGPRMLDMMNTKRIPWPHFTAQQMSDLIAYLNAL